MSDQNDDIQRRRVEADEALKADKAKANAAATVNTKPTESRPGMAPYDRPLEEVNPESYALKKQAALQQQEAPREHEEEIQKRLDDAAERESQDLEIAQGAAQAVAENTDEKKVLGPTPEEAEAQEAEAKEAAEKKEAAQDNQ